MGNYLYSQIYSQESWDELKDETHNGEPVWMTHNETKDLLSIARMNGNKLILKYFTRTLSLVTSHYYMDYQNLHDIPFIGYEYLPEDVTLETIPDGLRIPRDGLRNVKIMRYLLKRKREREENIRKRLGKDVGGIVSSYY